MQAQLIALDWGTSSLRAYKLGPAGEVLEQRSLAFGIMHLPKEPRVIAGVLCSDGFELAFDAACGDWLDAQLAGFCDYWHAKAGAQAVKLDWDATWRNWLRRASDQPSQRRPQPSNQPDWHALAARAQARDIAEGIS